MFGCDGCEQCDSGRYNLWVQGPSAHGVLVDGGMSEFFCARAVTGSAPVAWMLRRVFDRTDICCLARVQARRRLPRQRVAVVGGGAIGLLVVAAAQGMGAAEVGLEARHPHRGK